MKETLVSKAPTTVMVIAGTCVIIAVLASIVVLDLHGVKTDDLFRVINTVWNVIGVAAASGGLLYSGVAARRSNDAAHAAETAVEQTNGSLDARISASVSTVVQEQVKAALVKHLGTNDQSQGGGT